MDNTFLNTGIIVSNIFIIYNPARGTFIPAVVMYIIVFLVFSVRSCF